MNLVRVGTIKSISKFFFALTLFIIGSWAIVVQYRWNPDPHHDGIMLTGAIAYIDGYLPNSEYFAQYGPLTSIFQGFGLLVFGKTLLGLRLFTSSLLIITGVFLAHKLYRLFGFWIASSLWIVWTLTGPMGLPWASVISTTLIVICICISFQMRDEKLEFRSNSLLISTQLLTIGSLVRIQLLAIVFLVITVLLIKRKHLPKHLLRNLLSLTFLTLVSMVSVLGIVGILIPYVNQSIIWAFTHYATPEITSTYLSGLIWFVIVPIAMFCAWSILKICFDSGLGLRVISVFFVVILSLGIFLRVSKSNDLEVQSLYNLSFFLTEFCRRVLLSWDYLSISLFVFLAALMIYRSILRHADLELAQILLIAFGLGSLTQLYPLFDPWHIWMVSPIFVIILTLLVPRDSLGASSRKSLLTMSTAIGLILCLQLNNMADRQIFQFKSVLLNGMSSERVDSPYIDKTLIALEDLDTSKDKIRFLCTDGLYAAASQNYMSVDLMYVDWGLGLSPIRNSNKLLFVCNYTQKQIEAYVDKGWQTSFNIANGLVNSQNVILRNALLERG